jgi:hypothetical protein
MEPAMNKASIVASRRPQHRQSDPGSDPASQVPQPSRKPAEWPDDTLYKLFLEPRQAELPVQRLTDRFRAAGILNDDPRAREIFDRVSPDKNARSIASSDEFTELFALNPRVWSPPLDEHGNSVKGIEFCKSLMSKYSFHNFDIVTGAEGEKADPTRRKVSVRNARVVDLCWAAAKGDTKEIQRLIASGADINGADYDGRTALHVAASEGQAVSVQYILQNGGKRDAKDRWGNTPMDDARRSGHLSTAEIFEHIQG